MIPKSIGCTANFGPRIDYVQKNGEAVIATRNLISVKTAQMEMEAAAAQSRRCQKPCYHVVLSWAALENPTDEQMIEAADIALAELGMEECQSVLAIHRDREHQHVHLVVNRVHPETGKAVPISNDFAKLERACRKLEHVQGWSQDRGRFEAELVRDRAGNEEIALVAKVAELPEQRPPSQAERAFEARTGALPLADQAPQIAAEIGQAKSWADLHQRLSGLGVAYERKGSGAVIRSLADAQEALKASGIDRKAGISQLEKRLGPYTAPATQRTEAIPSEPVAHAQTKVPTPVRKTEGTLYAEYQQYKQKQYEYIGNLRKEQFEKFQNNQKLKRDNLFKTQQDERDRIYRLFPRGIIRRVVLWFKERQHRKARTELRQTLAAERASWKESRPGAQPPRWRDWLASEAEKGRLEAREALTALMYRDRAKGHPAAKKTGIAAISTGGVDREAQLAAIRQLSIIEIAQKLGYQVTPDNRAGAASIRLKAEDGEVIVARPGDGRWFSTADNRRNGDVFRLVQHRRGDGFTEARDWLSQFVGAEPERIARGARPLAEPAKADHTDARRAWLTARPADESRFLANRGISAETIARFSDQVRVDARGNALFAHRDRAKNIVGFEVKNDGYAGFAKGGQKTVAVFGDSAAAKCVMITESGLDALSIAQIDAASRKSRDTIYVSTGGALGCRALDQLAEICRDRTVIIGTDRDAKGDQLAEQISVRLAGVTLDVRREVVPAKAGKDWNDALIAQSLEAAIQRARAEYQAGRTIISRRGEDQDLSR